MKLLTVQRRESIKAMLLEKESITVREVMETYDVSVETVRRDFDALAGEGFLNKIYGGATLKNSGTVQGKNPSPLKGYHLLPVNKKSAPRFSKTARNIRFANSSPHA